MMCHESEDRQGPGVCVGVLSASAEGVCEVARWERKGADTQVSIAPSRFGWPSPLIRDAGSETAVWTAAVVVADPFVKYPTEMALCERDQEIQALASYRANESFAMGIGLG
jgi:hypothetical protein